MAVDLQASPGGDIRTCGRTRRAGCGVFLGAGALLFAGAAGVTIAHCTGMPMAGMPMPGGWTLSMAWTRLPGQGWFAAMLAFLGMWSPMMLPSLLPALWRYRTAISDAGGTRQAGLTALVAATYFCVWTALGLAVFPAGAALVAILLQWPALSRAMPLATGVVVLAAAALQFTPWKARRLACCRSAPGALPACATTACLHGLRLGVRCVGCCAGLVAAQLALGVMDLRVMAAITALITTERLADAA